MFENNKHSVDYFILCLHKNNRVDWQKKCFIFILNGKILVSFILLCKINLYMHFAATAQRTQNDIRRENTIIPTLRKLTTKKGHRQLSTQCL